jgi:hypothetical protein
MHSEDGWAYLGQISTDNYHQRMVQGSTIYWFYDPRGPNGPPICVNSADNRHPNTIDWFLLCPNDVIVDLRGQYDNLTI